MSQPARVYYNKLVRDNIPSIIQEKGEGCEVRVLVDDQEFRQELFKKIREEASALAMVQSKEEFLQEYADLELVIKTLMTELAITEADFSEVQAKNLERKGGYTARNFLLWSEDTDYRSNETPQGIKNH
jgi:predicted house-cleaning noncanonical NTP pyrophosphatase (MazG superfamily)